MAAPVYIPPNRAHSPPPHQHLLSLIFLIIAILIDLMCYLSVVFINSDFLKYMFVLLWSLS